MSKQKKWTGSQTREFGDLHALLAFLILSCDTKSFLSHSKSPLKVNLMLMMNIPGFEGEKLSSSKVFTANELQPMPKQVSNLLYGPLASLYISETIAVARELNSSLTLIVDMLTQVVFRILLHCTVCLITSFLGILLLQELLDTGFRRAYEAVQQCKLLGAEKPFYLAC